MPTRALQATALGVALLLGACTADDSATSSPGAADSPGLTGEVATLGEIPELVAEVQPSVVSILRVEGGEGSGVIWSSDGIVVTNNHVVEGAEEVIVAFADGQRVPAEVIATDPRTDLAVLQVERDGLPAATFTDTLPAVGELALALGNPIGFENSVTQGIVSGLHRSIPGSAQISPALVDLIQTDAAISPGNSGGALVNSEGEVMGINVAYLPPTTPAVSVGFAIPSPTVRFVVEQLLDEGFVEHPFLGVQPATLTPQLAEQFDVEVDRGAVVMAVTDDGPAAEAGLEPGDVITAIDGERVEIVEDLLAALRQHRPGDEVTLTVVRDGNEEEVSVTLGELPSPG